MKPCVKCNTETHLTIEVTEPDPYGEACSEPGVPLEMTFHEPYCQGCQDKDSMEEHGMGINDWE